MRKLLALVLGLGLITVAPEQSQAQMTCTFSGQQSGSSFRRESTSITVNGVPQPTVTQTTGSSYRNVYPPTTNCSQIDSRLNQPTVPQPNWNQPTVPQFNWNQPTVPQFSNFDSSQWNKNYRGW